MKPNPHFSNKDRADPVRARSGRIRALKCAAFLLATTSLSGCSDDVVMRNPHTGLTETCQESGRGFDPWSQVMACVADHEARGWIRVGQK
jgi:hypothetical protein